MPSCPDNLTLIKVTQVLKLHLANQKSILGEHYDNDGIGTKDMHISY